MENSFHVYIWCTRILCASCWHSLARCCSRHHCDVKRQITERQLQLFCPEASANFPQNIIRTNDVSLYQKTTKLRYTYMRVIKSLFQSTPNMTYPKLKDIRLSNFYFLVQYWFEVLVPVLSSTSILTVILFRV
jgi:hypothetical protein